jgi:hypothetical protein
MPPVALRRLLLPAALVPLALAAAPAAAHEGNPSYRSVVRAIVPPTEGLSAQVLDHDDALLLVNRSGETVVVLAPGGVPYARLLADGTVQLNEHAPAIDPTEAAEEHEHADRGAVGGARLSASLDGRFLAHGDEHHDAAPAPDQPTDRRAGARPAWRTLDRTGRLEWHDGRIKYRAQPVPPQVTDESRQTKVKDWRVPLLVGGRPGAIVGTLTWVGEPGAGSSFPTAAVISLAVLVLLAGGAVLLVRRRRAAHDAGGPGAGRAP